MKHADLVMATANLIIAAGYKMKEQARQEMAEEDLGGGMFDQDVKEMREAASKCNEPQVFDTDERQQLDEQRQLFGTLAKSARKYKTGTPLYRAQVADTGRGADTRVHMEVRAPPEQIIAYLMAHSKQFTANRHASKRSADVTTVGERSSDHSLIVKRFIPLPAPIASRELVLRCIWEKLDDNTFFVAQSSCEHPNFPKDNNAVRMTLSRSYTLTRIGPKLTKLEMAGCADMGGRVPSWVNKQINVPMIVRTPLSLALYFTSVRPADTFNPGDASRLGHLLFIQLHEHRKNADVLSTKIGELIRMINVLRSAQAKYR
jgi:hypothetical protein